MADSAAVRALRAANRRRVKAELAEIRGNKRAAVRSERARERSHLTRAYQDRAYDRDLKATYWQALQRGEGWAVTKHLEDGARETEWLSHPELAGGPTGRELTAAFSPPRRRRHHLAHIGARIVKVRAYRRRYPGGGRD